jgi:aminomethyltransferase
MQPGRARYSLACNEAGGIIDDVIYYRLGQDEYLLVCNAANRQHVVPWLQRWSQERFPEVSIQDETEETAMIAFQGPLTTQALDSLTRDRPSDLRPFGWMYCQLSGAKALVGRTGYTGEDGFELIVPADEAPALWKTLMAQGATPCGLGARDVLRLESGLMLHGNDIDTTTTPLEAGLGRFVRQDKEFVGAEALRRQKQEGIARSMVGFVLLGQGIARHGYPILADGQQVGQVTSGTYSPTLDKSIGLGYVSVRHSAPGSRLVIDLRGRGVDAQVVQLPFYSRKRGA